MQHILLTYAINNAADNILDVLLEVEITHSMS